MILSKRFEGKNAFPTLFLVCKNKNLFVSTITILQQGTLGRIFEQVYMLIRMNKTQTSTLSFKSLN